ncbi:MAG: DUF3108 domain-containing protein [Candidatus Hydrogenedentota bacterium]|nr:MAG: DUF3108 domain-containing protein [Candidatus Hydrogenedentota bacterium]
MRRRAVSFRGCVFLLAGLLLSALLSARAREAWRPGERLTYAVKYGPIRAGTSILEVEPVEGHPAWVRLSLTSRSAGWFFYRVRSRIESIFDRSRNVTVRTVKNQREGDYHKAIEVEYEREKGKVVEKSEGRKHTTRLVSEARDVLGALYDLRTRKLKPGTTVTIPVQDGLVGYRLPIKILRRETVRVPAGRFSCLVVEPKMESEGVFVRRGRLLIWLTDDERHIPVRVRTMIPVGTVVVKLERMEGVEEVTR